MTGYIKVAEAIAWIEMHDPHYAVLRSHLLEIFIEAVDRNGHVFFDREYIPVTRGHVNLDKVRAALGY